VSPHWGETGGEVPPGLLLALECCSELQLDHVIASRYSKDSLAELPNGQQTSRTGLKVFLNYAHDDNTTLVLRIKHDLTAAGHHPWIDKAEIKADDDWRRSILDGLADTHCTLAFLSHHAVSTGQPLPSPTTTGPSSSCRRCATLSATTGHLHGETTSPPRS